MTPPSHAQILNSSHSRDASLTRGPDRHEEIEETENSAKFSKTNFTTLFDTDNRRLSQHDACAPVDDLSALWETPAKENDCAAALAALVILIAPSLESNRSEDLHG
jgi:hypothetical protein